MVTLFMRIAEKASLSCKKALLFISIAFLIISMSGCLTLETKEYSFTLKKGMSGEGSIKYINIMTDNKDSAGVPDSDYRELIDLYLNGDKIKDEYPNIRITKKYLYEEDNQLCGEITFQFDDISRVKFYKYKD